MSSACSSPLSRRSRRSSTGPLSPQTMVTTPRSSNGDFSPKLNSPSFNFASHPLTPPPEEQPSNHIQLPSPREILSPYSVEQRPSTPANCYFDISLTPTVEEPSAYDQLFNTYYQPLTPTSNFHNSPISPTPGAGYCGWSEYSRWTGYTGYPPAEAFYGPLPTPLSSNAQVEVANYEPIDPEKYQAEEWQTSDGRVVEYSAMHLHCATM